MKINEEILNALKEEVAKEAGLPLEKIGGDASFYALGLDSISSIVVLDELEKKLGVQMNPMVFWDYPTVNALAAHLTLLCKDE